ncbi:MAG TPA: magnesium transporter [Polyangiaceae bacterium]|nr:magnesium transporter [Polyangiaceae bacterium]
MRLSVLLAPDIRKLLEEDPEQVRDLLEEIHPEDLADIVSELEPDQAAALLARMPAEGAAPIFERLEEHEQEEVAEQMQPESMALIASEMAPDDRADLFSMLPPGAAESFLSNLEKVDPQAAEDVREIAKFPETSAGHLMTTWYVTARPTTTIAEAFDEVRTHAEKTDTPIYNVYALSDDGRLIGLVSLRELIIAAKPHADMAIDDLLTRNYISVPPEMDQEDVARRMAKYDINAMPVVDAEGTLLGIITIDDIVDVLTAEQTEDVQKIGGMDPLDVPYFQTTFFSFIRKRGVWLLALFIGEFFTQTALRHYDGTLSAIHGAAYYVPLLISAGGNSGSQSSTLVIRGLATGELKIGDWWRIFWREAGMGLVLGLGLAAVGFIRVLMYKDQHINFALTVGVALVGIVFAGCTIGSMLPIILKRLRVDPATSSTPFIASLVDVTGILVFVYTAQIVMAEVIASAAK